MRALKALVVIMGIMILVGVVALIVIIANRINQHGSAQTRPNPTAAPASSQNPATPIPVDLPKDAEIKEIIGLGDRIVLRILTPDGQQSLITLDPTTGQRLGTLLLSSRPTPVVPPIR